MGKPKNASQQMMINNAKKMAKSGKNANNPFVSYPDIEAVRSLLGWKEVKKVLEKKISKK